MLLPDPFGMTLHGWADATLSVMNQYPGLAPLYGENWQDWGSLFYNSPTLGLLGPPNPYAYDDWQDWAQGLISSLSVAPGVSLNKFNL
jgi:hypothetical protein